MRGVRRYVNCFLARPNATCHGAAMATPTPAPEAPPVELPRFLVTVRPEAATLTVVATAADAATAVRNAASLLLVATEPPGPWVQVGSAFGSTTQLLPVEPPAPAAPATQVPSGPVYARAPQPKAKK